MIQIRILISDFSHYCFNLEESLAIFLLLCSSFSKQLSCRYSYSPLPLFLPTFLCNILQSNMTFSPKEIFLKKSIKHQNCSFAHHSPPFTPPLPPIHKEQYRQELKLLKDKASGFCVLWQFLKILPYSLVWEALWLYLRDTGHDILNLRVKFFAGVNY